MNILVKIYMVVSLLLILALGAGMVYMVHTVNVINNNSWLACTKVNGYSSTSAQNCK